MSETKNSYVQRQTENIKSWTAELEKFQVKASRMIGKNVEKSQKNLEELKALHAGLKEKVDGIQKSSEEGWAELKTGADKAFKILDKSFKTAKSFFN